MYEDTTGEYSISRLFKSVDDSTKVEETVQKAYLDAVHQFYKTAFLRQFVSDFMEDGTLPTSVDSPHMRSLLDRQYQQNSTKSPYWFITVSVKQGITFDELKTAVTKQVTKKAVSAYFLCYETRHEPDEKKQLYEGLHCHMLLYSTIRPYDLKRSAKSTFKNLCDTNNPEIMNFKNIPEDACVDKIDYMLGNKKDSKLKGVEFTKAFRKRLDILDFYESNPPLSCRVAKKTPLIE